MKNYETLLHLTDAEIVKKVVSEKNTIHFKTLYDRYERKVYNNCLAFVKDTNEAEILTQEVFLELFIELHQFKGQTNFSTWLNAFTYKFCIKYLNSKSENYEIKKTNQKNNGTHQLLIDVSDNSLFHMREEKLQKAMQYLSPEDKTILLMKYHDDLSKNEIMILLNLNESEFQMRIKRAKAGIIEIYNKI